MGLKIERRIDVTEAAGLGEPVEMAVSLFLPEPSLLSERPLAIFAVPGGGYSRFYFDMRFPGHEDYSQADFHTARGAIFIAIDHVGVGNSTIPDLSRIGFQTFAATYDSCARQLAAELAAGSVSTDFPACPNLFKIGIGQSMGGAVTILTQGRFATFEAIAPLGKSAIHTALPQRSRDAFEQGKARFSGVEGGGQSHETLTHEGVDYLYAFHWEDVPADILEEDMKGGYPIRTTSPAFGSLTIPYCAVEMMVPGCMSEDAARIAVPVFIGNGERDVCPDPHAEPSAYRKARDITVFIVPRMAHMHNFASTRQLLWERLQGWADAVSETEA